MNNQQFEDTMNRLKKGYEELPDRSSPEEIMQYIHKNKDKNGKQKREKQPWIYAASFFLVLAIGSVLLVSQWANTDQMATEDQMDLNQTFIIEDETPESSAEIEALPRIAESAPSEDKTEITDVNRPEVITKTILVEGMEEEEVYTLYVDNVLKFSTYLPEQFKTEQVNSTDGNEAVIYPVFNDVQFADTYIRFFEPNLNVSAEQIAEDKQAQLKEMGIEPTELAEDQRRDFAKYHYTYQQSDQFGEFLVVERGARTILITIQYPAEMGDGIASRLHVLFSELEWMD